MTELLLLLMGHALADFGLQSEAMAKGKNRNRLVDPVSVPPGQKMLPAWGYWMTAHALIHGLAVTLILGPVWGIAETCAHWLIDFGKCENAYGIHYDQFAHLVCKVLWLALWAGFGGRP